MSGQKVRGEGLLKYTDTVLEMVSSNLVCVCVCVFAVVVVIKHERFSELLSLNSDY